MDLELIQKDKFIDFGSIEEGLRTSVIISLFTDRRIGESELPEGETSRRGFWADSINETNIGSRLWLLDRSKVTRETKSRAEEYAYEALEWLIEAEVVTDISVNGIFEGESLSLEVKLTLPGKKSINQKFNNIIESEKNRGL